MQERLMILWMHVTNPHLVKLTRSTISRLLTRRNEAESNVTTECCYSLDQSEVNSNVFLILSIIDNSDES